MTATFRAAFVLLTTVVFLGIAVCGEVVSRIFRTFVRWPAPVKRLSDHRVALPEQLHIQISFGRPARAGDVA